MAGSQAIQIEEVSDGWPSRARVRLGDQLVAADFFVAPVTLSHRNRDDRERRFQNPLIGRLPRGQQAGKPIVLTPERIPVLLGLWEDGVAPRLVAADALRRAGHTTRYSIFVPLTLLLNSASSDWLDQPNSEGEVMTAFDPSLLPVFVGAMAAGVSVTSEEMSPIIEAAGELEESVNVARARRAAYQLVRRKEFSREVCAAYSHECSMCGFDFALVVGAHIYPASAPSSQDQVWNGLALCHNHHAAFDAHRIWVQPSTRAIRIHPDLIEECSRNSACQSFVATTFDRLKNPVVAAHTPHAEMFVERYDYFSTKYDWASG
jgi:hypothetical protein